MKKLVKVLLTLVLAVAFVLPMAVVVFARGDDAFDTLSTRDSFTTVDQNNSYIYYDLKNNADKNTLSFSELKAKLKEKDNSVRRIVAFDPDNSANPLQDSDNLATGDIIKIQSITQNNDQTTYEDVKSYRFILYRDVNNDARVDISDYKTVVEYVKNNSTINNLYSLEAIKSTNSAGIDLSGKDNIEPASGSYQLDVSFTPRSTASYLEFELKYPNFFTYSDSYFSSQVEGWEKTITDNPTEKTLKITIYKEDFDGVPSEVEKNIGKIEFNLVSSAVVGTEDRFSVSQVKVNGVSNYGELFKGGASDLSVAVGNNVPTSPTVNSKNDVSITLNSIPGYQYYCSSSNALPSSSATWFTASAQTITFSSLQPSTTYYFYYRRNSNAAAYLMSDSVTTESQSAIAGPVVEDSDSSTIIVSFGSNFEGIYFSPNSIEPTSFSSWITLDSPGGAISGVGSYSVDKLTEKVVFSGLSGGRYYIFGKTSTDVISAATVWAPTPDINASDIKTTSDSITLPFASIYRYSLDGVNYFSAISKVNVTSTIYLQRETVDGDPNCAVFRGLEKDRDYTVYIRVYNESTPASKPCSVTVKTVSSRPATPTAPKVKNKTQIYIAVEFDKAFSYRINNSYWTAAFTTYPTEANMITLGNFAYYFNNSTNPTFIIFTKLTPDTVYKIDVKYADDSDSTTNISSVTERTNVCNHSYGPKSYIGNTLNYTQTCTICGNVKTGTDTPTHTHTFETVTVPSTCTTHGYTYQVCKADNYILPNSRVELPLIPHTEQRRVRTEPTCTQNGVAEIYCTVCGTVIRTEEIAATGHRYEIVTSLVEPTCTAAGYEIISQRCSVCGDEKEISRKEIAALGHNAQWVTTVEPTTTADGRKDYICSRCGEVLDTEVIPKLINYTKNANGTGTYEITVTESKALVTDAAKLAIADGDASVRVVFSGGESIELDPAMAAAFLRGGSYITLSKLSSDADASGNLEKAGFSSATHTVYEITAENAIIASGKATVTVNFSASEEGGAVNVYFVDAQGKKTKLHSTYANGKLTFETNHFSTYVVEQGKSKGSNTGLVIAIIAIVAVLLATGGTFGYMVYTSKKTKKRKFNF